MNELLHEQFVELCALFHTGELTEEEWALLQIHLAYCDRCMAAFDQFETLSRVAFPEMAAGAAADAPDLPFESQASLDAAEARLLASLGTPASPETEKRSKPHSRSLFAIAAIAACLLGTTAYTLIRAKHHQADASLTQTVASPAAQPSHIAAVQPESAATNQPAVEDTQHELDAAVSRSSVLTATNGELEKRLKVDEAQRDKLLAAKDDLAKQLATVQAQLQDAQSSAVGARALADKQGVRMATLEDNVRALDVALADAKSTLNDRDRMLALDKDFMSHDRDIRDLIGARNLYIADIVDVSESGKTAKPFGRVFYTQDRSLVFYGFDLEKQPGLKQGVAFQAWGTGVDHPPVSLGLFYQDDAHQRWVVRCNDAKTLARINMVFVTVEPQGGSDKPTGKPLLRAYLQIPPNHP